MRKSYGIVLEPTAMEGIASYRRPDGLLPMLNCDPWVVFASKEVLDARLRGKAR